MGTLRCLFHGLGAFAPCAVIAVLCCVATICWTWPREAAPLSRDSRGTQGGLDVGTADPENPCGPVCVSLVSRIHGPGVSLKQARTMVSPDKLGRASVDQLVRTLAALGLHARALRLPADRLWDLRSPTILHCRAGHFVVAVADAEAPSRLRLLIRGNGWVECFRQTPSLSQRCMLIGSLRRVRAEDIPAALSSLLCPEPGSPTGGDCDCGSCSWRFLCGGVDPPPPSGAPVRTLQLRSLVCSYRKLFLEAFVMQRLRLNAIAELQ